MLQVIAYSLIALSFVGWLLGRICDKANQKPQRFLPEPELPDSPATVQPVAPPLPQPEPQESGFWSGVGLVFGGLMAFAHKLYENQPNPLVSAFRNVAESGNEAIRSASGGSSYSSCTPTPSPKSATYCIVETDNCGTPGQRLWGGGYQTYEEAQRRSDNLNSHPNVANHPTWHYWVEEEPYKHRIW